MIVIDHRKDWALLSSHFKPYGIQVIKAGGDGAYPEMEYGDLMWTGSGPEGVCTVGVERKALSDLVSSIQSRRLSGHQLIGMLESYDYSFLVVEGVYRAGAMGELEVRKSRGGKWGWHGLEARGRKGKGGSTPMMLYRELSNYLQTLELKCGVQVIRTSDHRETAAWAAGAYRWFEKEWEAHRSHEEIYAPIVAPVRGKVSLRRAGPIEICAGNLPGVDRGAWKFGEVFKRPKDIANATVEKLMEVEGVGRVGAEKIVKWWEGRS